MYALFGNDNFLTRALTKLADLFCLSLLWLLCSVPIVTIGAANSALYFSVNKAIRLDGGGIWSTFWSSFLGNLKKATIAWIVAVVVMVALIANCYCAYWMYSEGSNTALIMVIPIVLLVMAMFTLCFLFPYISRFEDPVKVAIKNCFRIALSNIGSSFLLCIAFFTALVGSVLIPMGIFVLPAGCTWFASFILEKIFSKYTNSVSNMAEHTEAVE